MKNGDEWKLKNQDVDEANQRGKEGSGESQTKRRIIHEELKN